MCSPVSTWLLSYSQQYPAHLASARDVLLEEGPLWCVRDFLAHHATSSLTNCAVRLGNSGLKVSKIILGCMSYGSPGVYFAMHLLDSGRSRPAEWQAWVLPEEEGIKHIKAAYDAGINTFDTANVRSCLPILSSTALYPVSRPL